MQRSFRPSLIHAFVTCDIQAGHPVQVTESAAYSQIGSYLPPSATAGAACTALLTGLRGYSMPADSTLAAAVISAYLSDLQEVYAAMVLADSFNSFRQDAHLHAVGGPAAGLGRGRDVGLQLGSEGGQVKVDMLGGAQHRHRPRQLAFGIDQILSRQQVATLIALVATRILRGKKQC